MHRPKRSNRKFWLLVQLRATICLRRHALRDRPDQHVRVTVQLVLADPKAWRGLGDLPWFRVEQHPHPLLPQRRLRLQPRPLLRRLIQRQRRLRFRLRLKHHLRHRLRHHPVDRLRHLQRHLQRPLRFRIRTRQDQRERRLAQSRRDPHRVAAGGETSCLPSLEGRTSRRP